MSSGTETPCVPERATWRNCMAENDYAPDRDLRKCDESRQSYYDCINAWRAKNPATQKDRHPVGKVHPMCTGISDKLRVCMEIYMFETHRCQTEMNQLRECVAKVDREVRSVVAEVDADKKKMQDQQIHDMTGTVAGATPAQNAIWSELWEKKPSWGKEGKIDKPRV